MSEKEKTVFTSKQVAILRESLAGIHKKAPPMIKKKIETSLLDFANAIMDTCKCEDKVFIENENRFACLNCGYRHRTAEGSKKLKVVK